MYWTFWRKKIIFANKVIFRGDLLSRLYWKILELTKFLPWKVFPLKYWRVKRNIAILLLIRGGVLSHVSTGASNNDDNWIPVDNENIDIIRQVDSEWLLIRIRNLGLENGESYLFKLDEKDDEDYQTDYSPCFLFGKYLTFLSDCLELRLKMFGIWRRRLQWNEYLPFITLALLTAEAKKGRCK